RGAAFVLTWRAHFTRDASDDAWTNAGRAPARLVVTHDPVVGTLAPAAAGGADFGGAMLHMPCRGAGSWASRAARMRSASMTLGTTRACARRIESPTARGANATATSATLPSSSWIERSKVTGAPSLVPRAIKW